VRYNLNLIYKNKLWYLINIALTVFFLLPIVWTVSTSFKKANEIISPVPKWIPTIFTLEHFTSIWQINDHIFVTYFVNSVILTVFTVLLNVLVSSMAGYALAKLQVPCKGIILALFLSTIMVPFQSLLIPLFKTMQSMGLLNTHLALVIIYVTFFSPICVYIMINIFATIPDSLRESAQIDGASEMRIFVKIMLPLVWPGLATVAIYTAYRTWNDYIIALIFTSGDSMRTLNIGITNFALGIYGTNWGLLTAGAFISFVPMILLYAFLQRYFISGLTSGSVKQ
jgi:multiple sugar transport system permease protein